MARSRQQMPMESVAPDSQGPRDQFATVDENPWKDTTSPGGDASTFSIDVDTASYTSTRAWLQRNQLPQREAVRIEEMLNYFSYNYDRPSPGAEHPVIMDATVTACPWNADSRLVRVNVAAEQMEVGNRPPSNLVFLLDVSGSMNAPNKLGLIKSAFIDLVKRLDKRDRIALVVYAGASGLVLPSTPASEQETIIAALSKLRAGGSTNGGAGIQLAYATAAKHLIKGGNNRVILATDGDFNVGTTDNLSLVELVKKKAEAGIDLTVLGVGQGNYMDHMLEAISNDGEGTYHYIDTQAEADKVFGTDLTGSLVTVARDVKTQIFFNPALVAKWRQIGYVNRQLEREDFDNDEVDAGEVGAGHTVTALYEIQTRDSAVTIENENPFIEGSFTATDDNPALLRLRLRYQPAAGGASRLQEQDIVDGGAAFAQADDDLRWAVTVAAWSQLLRGSEHLGDFGWSELNHLVGGYTGRDPHGYRGEAMELMATSAGLAGHPIKETVGKLHR